MENQKLILFQDKQIRREWHDDKWFFSVVDIIEILADTDNPRQYWTKVKKKLLDESQLQPFWLQLKMKAADQKSYKTDAADTEGLFRIMMSVPSPKAEPFKLWLSQVGREKLEEIADPELGFDRLRDLYKAKGYPDEWIERRMQSIETRRQLTDEWKARGVAENKEYAILTAQIAKATFGLNPSEHKTLKGLEHQNLRDHMTPLELIFTALSEETTRQIAVRDDAKGFPENLDAAYKGGTAAGNARQNYETETGLKVVAGENFLNLGKELPTDGKT